MEKKIRKYIWIGFCVLMVCFLVIIQYLYYGFDNKSLSVINVAYILSFITAIVYELRLNKWLFYCLIAIAIFMIAYGYFFAQFL